MGDEGWCEVVGSFPAVFWSYESSRSYPACTYSSTPHSARSPCCIRVGRWDGALLREVQSPMFPDSMQDRLGVESGFLLWYPRELSAGDATAREMQARYIS